MQNYVVTPEFKTRVTDILNTKKFTSVFAFMNLINREGFIFTEAELLITADVKQRRITTDRDNNDIRDINIVFLLGAVLNRRLLCCGFRSTVFVGFLIVKLF